MTEYSTEHEHQWYIKPQGGSWCPVCGMEALDWIKQTVKEICRNNPVDTED